MRCDVALTGECYPGIGIEMHIFVGSKAPWEVVPDGAVTYHTVPPGVALGHIAHDFCHRPIIA